MTGSIQTKNGKFYAVLNYRNKEGKRKQKWVATNLEIRGNKRKAEMFLQKALLNYSDISELGTDLMFDDYIFKWLLSMKGELETSTYEGYKNIIDHHIRPYFKRKKIKLSELTPKDISAYYAYKLEKLSASTIKRHHANIRKCLQSALIEGMITSNPADRVKLPKANKYNAQFYDSEQVKVMLDRIKGVDIEPIVILCSYYGLRRSEVLGLKWSAVNFTNDTIRIINTITKTYTYCEKERTKNRSSNRTLPLIPVVKEYLLKLKAKQAKNRRLFGNCYVETEYICVKMDGSVFTPDEVSHKFKLFLKKSKLLHIRLHDLRHSCASLLIAQGVDIKVIQEWLGHSSIATTGNIYGHLQFKQKVETGAILESLLEANSD